MKPLEDRVVILRDKAEENAGTIYLPEIAREVPVLGTVVAIGPGKISNTGKIMPTSLKTGDRVLFGKYSGTKVEIEEVEHLIMRESDILGVYHEKL